MEEQNIENEILSYLILCFFLTNLSMITKVKYNNKTPIIRDIKSSVNAKKDIFFIFKII